jgi:hypothetical protein
MRTSFYLLPSLTYGLIAAGLILLVGLLAWSWQRPRWVAGTAVFRYHFALQASAFFIAFGVPAGLTAVGSAFRYRRDEIAYFYDAYLGAAAVGLPLFWEATRFFVRVTQFGIECRSAWRPYRVLIWDEIREVRYNPFNSWFVFVDESGQRIRVPAVVGRLTEFLHLVESRLPPETLVKARTGYDRLGRVMPKLGNEPVLEARPPRR